MPPTLPATVAPVALPTIAALSEAGQAATAQLPSLTADPSRDVVAPSTSASFLQMMTKSLLACAVLQTLPRHRPRPKAPLGAPVRRSIHLAKKAATRPLAVVAAQTLLMRKLGISSGPSIETVDFDRYVKAFTGGLTLERANIIDELFMNMVCAPDLVEEEVT
jgi:hypothetical protein